MQHVEVRTGGMGVVDAIRVGQKEDGHKASVYGPSSQPLITSPTPILVLNGFCLHGFYQSSVSFQAAFMSGIAPVQG